MNRCCAQGFTLIELLVYTIVSSFLIVVVMRYLSYCYQDLADCSAKSLAYSALWAAIDVWSLDCRQAPADKRYWYDMSDSKISWQSGTNRISFLINNNRLTRYMYDGVHKPAVSILVNGVQGSFAINFCGERINSVTLSMVKQLHTRAQVAVTKKIYLYGGITL